MIHATTEASSFALEITTCPTCKHLLSRYDFGFDWLGRTMSLCPKCGPALLVVRHGAPRARERAVPIPRLGDPCLDCGEPVVVCGTGQVPVRCKPCQLTRSRARNLISNKESRRRLSAFLHRDDS
jgi:hypothetical protein